MKQLIMRNKKRVVIASIIVLVVFPAIVYVLTVIPLFPSGGNNDWAGFWGGYLGAIVGGIITLFVMFTTIESTKHEKLRDEKIKFYEKLIDKVSVIEAYQKVVISAIRRSDHLENSETYEKAIIDYNNLLLQIKMMLEIEREKGIHKDIFKVIKCLDDFLKASDELLDEFQQKDGKTKVAIKPMVNKLTISALIKEVQNFVVKNTVD